MQSSPSSSLNNNTHRHTLIALVTWLCRIVIGGVFVFSGFVKGIDPWGTVYKMDEYLVAMGMPLYDSLILAGVFGLCALEFLIGIYLIFGCYRKSAPMFALLFMCVMLPLTLWIAIADPVADCGCFGDALVISNWATFWKNVAITCLIIWLIKFNRRVPCIITPAFQWMAFVATVLYMICICWYGYNIQPMLDFRPFAVGTDLGAEVVQNEESEDTTFLFTYTKDGVTKDFTAEEVPADDSGWTFVSRKEIFPDGERNNKAKGHDFSVMDRDGNEEVTSEAIDSEGKELLLLIPSLDRISASTTYKINMLHDWATAKDIRFVAIVAAHTGDIAEWEDMSMPGYDIYTADDTAIKELARGNPAVVYLKDGVIKWKTSLYSINEDEFTAAEAGNNVNAEVDLLPYDGKRTLINWSLIYLAVMAMLVCISFVPRFARLFRPLEYKGERHKKEHAGKNPSDMSDKS